MVSPWGPVTAGPGGVTILRVLPEWEQEPCHRTLYTALGAPESAPDNGPLFPGGRLAKTLRSRGQRSLLAVLVASRREAGLTQRELAERLGKPASYIGKIETGERRLDLVEFVAIAKALKVDPRVLFERFLSW